MSERTGDLIWNILCAVWISSTCSPRSSSRLSDCATRAWISPAYCGGESFSNSMLRLERRRNENGSHRPSGIFILISELSTSVTGRRQIERRSASEPLMTICVTSSMVWHMTPSTARMMSPWMSVPSRSAGPPLVMAPTVTSPSHRSTAMPSVPPTMSRTMVTSKNSSLSECGLRVMPSYPSSSSPSAAAAATAPASACDMRRGIWPPLASDTDLRALYASMPVAPSASSRWRSRASSSRRFFSSLSCDSLSAFSASACPAVGSRARNAWGVRG